MQSILTQILLYFFINLITWYDVHGCGQLQIQMIGGNYSNTIKLVVLLVLYCHNENILSAFKIKSVKTFKVCIAVK